MKFYLIISILFFFLFGCSNGTGENTIEASGTIEAVSVTLSSKSAGEIKEIRFEEGDKVSAGDTLIIIDNEIIKIQLKQAEAVKAMTEAQHQLLLAGARSEDINQAEHLLNQSEINFRQAEINIERMTNLLNTNSITRKQFEEAETRYLLSESQYSSAKENLNKMKNISRPEEVKQSEARLNQAAASVELINKNIENSYLISPLNGYIIKKYFEPGETVSNLSSIMKISDLSFVDLTIYVNETELGKIKTGQKVNVKIDSFKNKVYEGRIVHISPESEFTPKNIQTKDERTKLVFAVKIKIPNPDLELKAGLPADAEIILE
jgi:HlyD family secretion protein